MCIHVTREPLEIVSSLAARNELPLPVCAALWEAYTLRGVQATDGLPRCHLPYEDLVTDPVGAFGRLLDRLESFDVQGLRRPSDREITAFMDPSLHRHRRAATDRAGLLNVQQAARRHRRSTPTGSSMPGGSTRIRPRGRGQRCSTTKATSTWSRGWPTTRSAAEQHAVERLRSAEVVAREIQRAVDDGLDEVELQLRSIERSRAWRAAQQAMYARQRLSRGVSQPEPRRIEKVLRRLEQVRRTLESPPSPPASRTAPAITTDIVREPARGTAARRRGAPPRGPRPVDVGPAEGRGHRVGRRPQPARARPRAGRRAGAPVRRRDLGRAVRPLRASALGAAATTASSRSTRSTGAAVPRAPRRHGSRRRAHRRRRDLGVEAAVPSLALGCSPSELRNRPLVLDVDDHELAFFDDDDGLALAELSRLRRDDLDAARSDGRGPGLRAARRARRPTDRLERRAARALRRSHRAARARRARLRSGALRPRRVRAGARHVGPYDRLLLFGGTPRAHKGIVEVLEALERSATTATGSRCSVPGSSTSSAPQIGQLERWMLPLPYQRFDELPPLVGAADLSCVLQDPDHPVSRYQMPPRSSTRWRWACRAW